RARSLRSRTSPRGSRSPPMSISSCASTAGARRAREARDVRVVGTLRGTRFRPAGVTPHPGPAVEEDEQTVTGGRSGALRAAIFGINDGLVSNLSLIMGVTGAAVSNRIVVVAGVAGLLAGAFSMAAGEYISMRSQREVFERLIHLEAHELATEPEEEREELIDIYRNKGVPAD